ncbi:blastula protease 10-like [Lytechinus pictus]|uniref:blastula protease 10-like n=1 Tax=Lytechinus pictus TaxID=7653 RepID=UPI0030B9C505
MKTALVLSFIALLIPGLLGLPLTDNLLNRMTRNAKEEKEIPTEAPPLKKPLDGVAQHLFDEPIDEDPTPGAFQGDMMLTVDQLRQIEEAIDDQKAGRKKRKAVINENARWTLNIVPYEISPSSSGDSQVIRAAMDHWEQHTCLRFEPRTSSHASDLGHNTYLSFIKGGGCWSFVGRVFNGEQQISIGSGCEYLGIVAHEIGHAIGFHHEQSRPDRDDYINVHFENIQSGLEDNFEKYDWNYVTTRNVEYDVGSVMHYGSHGFSSNGQPTITTIDPLQMHLLGNRAGLSNADITLANLIYECDNECSGSEQCQNGGYHDTNCICVCPPGYSGDLCQDGSGPTTTPPCYQRLTDTQGEITSPNYPSNYDNDQECMYLIEGVAGSTIELTFVDMDIENENLCRYDSVEVRKDDINAIGEKFCGSTLPPVQISSSNQMLVSFTSDYSITGRGFKATYVIQGVSTTEAPTTTTETTTNPPVVGTCGGSFDDNQGSLASPNYPNDYDNNLRCVYVIEVEADRRVELTFADFSLEDQSTCRWDALEIDLGDGVKVPMKMCGSEYPAASLVSIGNRMELTLKTDGSVTSSGFRADYRVIDL